MSIMSKGINGHSIEKILECCNTGYGIDYLESSINTDRGFRFQDDIAKYVVLLDQFYRISRQASLPYHYTEKNVKFIKRYAAMVVESLNSINPPVFNITEQQRSGMLQDCLSKKNYIDGMQHYSWDSSSEPETESRYAKEERRGSASYEQQLLSWCEQYHVYFPYGGIDTVATIPDDQFNSFCNDIIRQYRNGDSVICDPRKAEEYIEKVLRNEVEFRHRSSTLIRMSFGRDEPRSVLPDRITGKWAASLLLKMSAFFSLQAVKMVLHILVVICLISGALSGILSLVIIVLAMKDGFHLYHLGILLYFAASAGGFFLFSFLRNKLDDAAFSIANK